ncbi:MAG TPA: hypothetical protein VFQ53_27695 [Kofleriaceae bacterium]|nr:hypothetical protein [Kofleriaceae bacterium]
MYSPLDERTRWIESELARDRVMLQIGRSVEHVVSALTEDPTPRPSVLVIDIDAVSAPELLRLHLVREQGWCGSIIALGKVAPVLRTSLAIDIVLPPPFVEDALRDSIARYRRSAQAQTVRIPVV